MYKKILVSFALSALLSLSISSHSKPYRGAEVYSHSEFLFGRFSARIRAASGEGVLSTLFTYKNASEKTGVDWEEIDIEIFGKGEALFWQSNVITGKNGTVHKEKAHCFEKPGDQNFHTVTIEWTPDVVRWLVDGVELRRIDDEHVKRLRSPQTLRSNIWASSIVSWVGNFRPEALPVSMYIDWIEVHSWSDGDFTLAWRDEFQSFDNQRWGKASWTFENNLVSFDPQNVRVRNGYLILSITSPQRVGSFVDLVDETAASLNRNVSDEYCGQAPAHKRVNFDDLELFRPEN